MFPAMFLFVSPGIENNENEDNETDHQQHDEPGLALPDLPDAALKIFQIHPIKTYTRTEKRHSGIARFPRASSEQKKCGSTRSRCDCHSQSH
ncbi:MAG TPA: hypothetical protein VFM25_00990 [Verrucomicrobiae bacterium]|jgi:hypothetical protein|nr:hypothetical protein [Verrucomicrobiae bacterium]